VLGDGSDLDARIRYSWEQPQVLGSAGGPRHALGILGASRFFIVNGDVLTDVDLRALEAAHVRNGAQVTMALLPNRDPLKYGGVQLDNELRVTGFVKRGPAAAGSFHFIGPQVTNAVVFQGIAEGTIAHTVGEIYDRLIATNPGAVRGFIWDHPFLDIGTVADYVRCSRELVSDPAASGTSTIAATARVRNSIVWDDVTVAANATVDGCILTDGVSIPSGAQFRDQILVADGDGRRVLTFPIGPIL
jgi:mannose-1-phosphate guanylyltransferase